MTTASQHVNAEAGPSSEPYRMRISSGGNTQNYVRFALSFLHDNPNRPLVLHTVPPEPTKQSGESDTTSPRSTLHACTLSVPRLISVVEQVKREFVARPSPAGKHRASGVWQYTESGSLPVPKSTEEDRQSALARALDGKTGAKMIHRPYLQITLSTKPLGLEKERNVTCQYVLRKRSRSGKQRGKKAQEGGEAEEGTKARKDSGHKRKSSASLGGKEKKLKSVKST